MACCILGAIIMSQLIAIWRARRRIVLSLFALLVSTGAFAWQLDQHWSHVQQFAWDLRALARGQDPAEAALDQPALRCNTDSPADPFHTNSEHPDERI